MHDDHYVLVDHDLVVHGVIVVSVPVVDNSFVGFTSYL